MADHPSDSPAVRELMVALLAAHRDIARGGRQLVELPHTHRAAEEIQRGLEGLLGQHVVVATEVLDAIRTAAADRATTPVVAASSHPAILHEPDDAWGRPSDVDAWLARLPAEGSA